MFSDLAAGNYRFRASAANHQDLTGRFTIKPGFTGHRDLFLDYNLISVEWSVTEITIEDKYEITLQAIFETDVPAAVVVMEPASVTLPEMAPGDLFYGELRLTNHGLIRADDLTFTLPGSDAYFRYEFLDVFPKSMESKESLLIPYRITALTPLNPDGSGGNFGSGTTDSGTGGSTGSGTGGSSGSGSGSEGSAGGGNNTGGSTGVAGCRSYQQSITGRYGYTCANGSGSGGSCGTTFVARVDRSQCSGTGSIGSASTWSGGWGGGGVGSVSGGVNYSPIEGAKCIPGTTCSKCKTCKGKNPEGSGPGGN